MAYSEKYKQARSKWLNDQGESLPEPEPAVRVPSQKFLEMQNKWKAETPDVQEDDLPQLTPKGESVGWDKINSGLKSIAKSYSSKFGTPTYTSGFRTQEEQDSLPVVGKARVSRHTSGRALDERIKDLTPEQIQQRLSFYNSQPKTKASVHNKNHIHVEYLGDDAPIEDAPISKEPPKDLNPIDSFYNRFQKAIVSGAGKKSTLTNDRKVSSAPMSPDDPISEMMGDYARENKLDNLKNSSTSTVPRVTNVQRSPEVRKFFDEWLQPQSDSTFIDTPVVPPAISRTIAKVANKTTPLQFLTPKVQDAVEEFLSENISGFTTPKNLGIGGALLTPAAPYVLAATLPGMIEGTYEAGKGTYEAVKNKDTKGMVKGGLNTILSALMTGGGIKGSAKGIAGDFAKVRSKIQAPEPTVPEAPQTIQAQIDSLKQGRNKAVLLTEGEVPADLPSNIKTIQTDVGTWLFDPLKINKTKIQKSVENGTYGNILGHKEIKGPETTEVVTARLPNGVEAKSSVVSPDNLNSQAKELKRQFPDSSIEFGGPEKAQQIISERKSLVRAPEPVYLGSGLGGLQQLFEKDPIQQARLEKISNIEKEAKASNKKLAEVYKEKEANGEAFDPDLYSELMTRQRELARKAEKSPTWQRVQDFKREVKTKLVDSASPMEDVLRYWEKEHPDQKPINSLTRTEALTDRIDKSLRSVYMAAEFIKENGLEGVVKSLKSIKDLDTLDQYLTAKHAPEREALSKTTGRELDLDNKFIQAKAQEFEPHAKIVQDYAQKLLDYSVDAGLVSSNAALELKQRYPNYVPLNRVFNELEVVPSNFKPKGPASIGKQTVVQKAVGSSREIESPIASLMEKTADAFMQGERNKTAQYLTELETLEGNPFGLKPLRTAENVNKRINLYSELKELKPIKIAVENILATQGKQVRKLQFEINSLEKQGLLKSLKKENPESPTPLTSSITSKTRSFKEKFDNLISLNQEKITQLQKEINRLEEQGYKKSLSFQKTEPKFSLKSGVKLKVPVERTGLEGFKKKGTPKVIQDLYALTKNRGEFSTKSFVESLIQKPFKEIEILKKQIATKEGKLTELLNKIEELKTEYEGKPFETTYETTYATTKNRGEQSTKNFIEALITNPNADIQAIKQMVTNRESKLGSLLDDIEYLKEGFEEINQKRKNVFDEAKLLRDAESKGKSTINVFRDGIKEVWEVDPEIAAAAKSLNIQQFGLLARMLRKPSLIFKAGTTGVYPVFALMNLIKDTGHALTLSKNSRGGALSTPFGLKEAYSGGEFSKMLAREGAMDSSFDPFRNQFLKNVKEIRSDKDLASKLKFRINPLNIFKNIEDVINVGERTTRIAQAKAAYDSALKSGMSVQDAQIKAALAYRKTTTDFFRKGEWGNVMNSISPYLNAGIQGSRTLVRRLHESPIKTTSKIMALIALPTALSTIYNLNDPKRREAYMDMNEKEKDDNIVVISPWASFNKDSNSWEGIVKIPKPQGISSLLRPMTKYIEHLYDVDPQSFGSMAKELLNAGAGAVLPFEPSAKGIASFAIPPPIKGIAENVYNRDFYFNKPIVPDYIDRQPSRDLPPERQTLPRTSFVANKLGNALKVSPLKIDHQIRSTLGSMGYSTTRALDSLLNLTGVASDKEVQRLEGKPLLNLLTLGTAPEFSRRLSKVRAGEIDRKIADEAHLANQDSFVKKQDIHRSAVAFLEDMKNLSSEERKQRIDELTSQPEVLKKVMKLMEEEASGFTYADKAIDNLSTKDGTRARFISQKLKSFKNSDDRNRFLDNLIEKKLITKEVMQQMMAD